MLIHILRENGLYDDVEESLLLKTEYVAADNDDYTTTWTEYCRVGCAGDAHRTGAPASSMVFCAQHVHHSVHVTMKRWPDGMGAIAGSFG